MSPPVSEEQFTFVIWTNEYLDWDNYRDAFEEDYSLRQKGLKSKLDDLGFDDLFYAWILAMHPDFAYQRVFGNVVLLKTNESAFTSKRDFIRWLLSDYDSVDVDDFMSDCRDNYGITIPERFEITEAISGTDRYYDPIMNRIYSDKSIYYDELSDELSDE